MAGPPKIRHPFLRNTFQSSNVMSLTLTSRLLPSRSSLTRTTKALTAFSQLSTLTVPEPAQPPQTTYLARPVVSTRRHFAKMSHSAAAASHDELNRNSLFNLRGRVALVTGGGSGIGLMITQALAVNGAKVYIVGRTKEKLDRVVETYNRDVEGEIVALPGDVSSKEDVARLARELSARERCLCILVNNAGVSSATVQPESATAADMSRHLFDTSRTSADDWLSAYRTDVVSLFFMTTAFLPLLAQSSAAHPGWSGTVLNIGSISGLVKVAQHHFAYNAAKAAAHHLTRMLAGEVAAAGHKVRVNAIAPGVFPSEMTAGASDQWQKSHLDKEKYEGKVPAGRPGRDVDMAQAVLGLVANQYIDGQTLVVDGGYALAMGQ
ncbi:hypothetical protein VTK26DRAFT_3737 [Humicola hyalothermophila]